MPFTLFAKNDIASAKILPASAKGICSNFPERSKILCKDTKKKRHSNMFSTRFSNEKAKERRLTGTNRKEKSQFDKGRRRLHRIWSEFSTETARDFSGIGG